MKRTKWNRSNKLLLTIIIALICIIVMAVVQGISADRQTEAFINQVDKFIEVYSK